MNLFLLLDMLHKKLLKDENKQSTRAIIHVQSGKSCIVIVTSPYSMIGLEWKLYPTYKWSQTFTPKSYRCRCWEQLSSAYKIYRRMAEWVIQSLACIQPVSISIMRVPDQNGVSQAWYIVEIHHSGRKPSIYIHVKCVTWPLTCAELTAAILSMGQDKRHWCHCGCYWPCPTFCLCCCHGLQSYNSLSTTQHVSDNCIVYLVHLRLLSRVISHSRLLCDLY